MKCLVRVCITTLALTLAGAALPAASAETAQRQPRRTVQHSPTAAVLTDISCASPSECFAVGSHATILKTENGGRRGTLLARKG